MPASLIHLLSAAKLIKDTLGAGTEFLGFFDEAEFFERGTLERRVRGFRLYCRGTGDVDIGDENTGDEDTGNKDTGGEDTVDEDTGSKGTVDEGCS